MTLVKALRETLFRRTIIVGVRTTDTRFYSRGERWPPQGKVGI